jgi:hypothetical protein
LGLVLGVCSVGLELAEQRGLMARLLGPQDPEEIESEKEVDRVLESGPAYHVIDRGTDVLNLAICLAMVASGFGLLGMKPWGRKLAIVAAALDIVVGLIVVSYALAFTVPAVYEFVESRPPANIDEQIDLSVMKFRAIGPILPEVVFMIYPVIVLLVMMRSSVSVAFRQRLGQPE